MKPAAIYCRVSTTNLADHGTSLETQKEAGLAKARELCQEISEEFIVMEDWSGTDLQRPGLQQILNWARLSIISVIIIYTLDRLYRPENEGDEWHIFEILQQFEDAGVEVVWVDPTVPSKGPMTAIFTFLDSWRSGQERRAIRERTRSRRLAIANKGGLLGGFTPYGYEYVPKTANSLATLAIKEEQARVVREIYRWLIDEQLSSPAIAKRLMDSGILSPQGRESGVQA